MKFCCDGFRLNLDMAGSRGFGGFSTEGYKGEAGFIIQHRAMELGQDAPFTKSPISLVSEMYIRYCPWCGKNLERFYGLRSELMRPDLKL